MLEALCIHPFFELGSVAVLVEQRLSVIREWQRHKPASRNPTFDFAEDNAVRQCGAGRRACDNHRAISIGRGQGFKPALVMKRGRPGVRCNQIIPAAIEKWVQGEKRHRTRDSVKLEAGKVINRGDCADSILPSSASTDSKVGHLLRIGIFCRPNARWLYPVSIAG